MAGGQPYVLSSSGQFVGMWDVGCASIHIAVYSHPMTRTNIDIDEELVERAMKTFGLRTKRQAVHVALERLVGGGPMSLDEQLGMEGIGWEGDLEEMRANRIGDWGSSADS